MQALIDRIEKIMAENTEDWNAMVSAMMEVFKEPAQQQMRLDPWRLMDVINRAYFKGGLTVSQFIPGYSEKMISAHKEQVDELLRRFTFTIRHYDRDQGNPKRPEHMLIYSALDARLHGIPDLPSVYDEWTVCGSVGFVFHVVAVIENETRRHYPLTQDYFVLKRPWYSEVELSSDEVTDCWIGPPFLYNLAALPSYDNRKTPQEAQEDLQKLRDRPAGSLLMRGNGSQISRWLAFLFFNDPENVSHTAQDVTLKQLTEYYLGIFNDAEKLKCGLAEIKTPRHVLVYEWKNNNDADQVKKDDGGCTDIFDLGPTPEL
ncbi:hypothetical protein AB8O64_35665 (plasmid) [Streptomyces sp. QH1-20]|uniref:hypothetical protein n=1 Tax=Streptomyces sp. QH1-20 TaxID=3240934 RepID=UPI003517B03B